VTPADVASLRCPTCRGRLEFAGDVINGRLESGRLRCEECSHHWRVTDGLPNLVAEASLSHVDRSLRRIYDWIAPLHDPGTRLLLPVLQGSSESATRDGHMRRLALARLEPGGNGSPVRILEVGIGSGGNLPWLMRDLPRGLAVELWGLDISRQMLGLCRTRVLHGGGPLMRLLLADGHALPFPDASFDRVYNVGGIGGYGDPRRALAEMARVARPGTPIVVVDEQLDPHRAHSPWHRLAFAALTLGLPEARCPVDLLPPGAVDVVEEQVSRFYYCLTFRMLAP
jgi:ubiquinone/menaquinone biosynthesis C-methylase UbiE/uncharacterized protein YbaR (Trm112 family)